MVYSTRLFVLCLTLSYFVLAFFRPFNIAITSLGEERASLSAFRTFARFALVSFYLFPLPLGVWEGLQFVIVALPGLFSYNFFFFFFFFTTDRSKVLVLVLLVLCGTCGCFLRGVFHVWYLFNDLSLLGPFWHCEHLREREREREGELLCISLFSFVRYY